MDRAPKENTEAKAVWRNRFNFDSISLQLCLAQGWAAGGETLPVLPRSLGGGSRNKKVLG